MPETHSEHQDEVSGASLPLEADDGSSQLDPADFEPRELKFPALRRTLTVVGILLALMLAVVLPPLLNVNRFRRQIATSISGSLGRPVHMDAVTLNLLPIPGFTLENFVVGEDPAFGSEPVIHANSVQARLRIRSLWRRRVEFSRISLTDTSVNLVHHADGRWNVESILLQAAKIDAAPTQQRHGGSAPRFPYIEATNARVNVKMGLEKMPLALTETEFALWLPESDQWRLRMVGHPSRTDNAATDTGLLRVEGALGKAGSLAEVPVDLTAEWSAAPLGAVSWVLLGRDAGFRGDLRLHAAVKGTVGQGQLTARVSLRGARRADFVPARPLDLDITCRAREENVFHRLADIQCTEPADTQTPALILRGEIAECLHPQLSGLQLTVQKLDASRLLNALRLASPRVAPGLKLNGTVSGEMSLQPAQGQFNATRVQLADGDGAPFLVSNVSAQLEDQRLSVAPVPLALGGEAMLEGSADRTGYSLHLAGTLLRSRLLALAAALPQFGDGLANALPPMPDEPAAPEEPIRVDLVSQRPWDGGQSWNAVAAWPPVPRRHRRR